MLAPDWSICTTWPKCCLLIGYWQKWLLLLLMDYNNSSRRFRPWGSRVMALSIKCDSLALRTESHEERIFSSGINCMSVWEWLEWERKCSETVVGLDLMLVLSTARVCSLNLSLRRRLVSPIYRVSPKFVPLISCAITFDRNFYFYMKFLKYNYYSVEYLCSEVQLPACPLCFLSHPVAVAALSEISHVACRALDDSFWAFFIT